MMLQRRPEGLLAGFERELGDLGELDSGTLAGGVVAAYYRGAFYSGIEEYVVQVKDGWGDPAPLRPFLASLGTVTAPPAQHLAIWVDTLAPPEKTKIAYVQGTPHSSLLASSLQLGPIAIQRVLRTANSAELADQAMRAEGSRTLIGRADARPENRETVIVEALYDLHDLALVRRACLALEVEGGSDFHASLCARSSWDKEKLLALARSTQATPRSRTNAVIGLFEQRLATAEEVDAEFEHLLPSDNSHASVAMPYILVLENRHEYRRAQDVAEHWLKSFPEETLDALVVKTARARMMQRQGDPGGAWRELEPLVASWQGNVMERAALVLSELGRHDEAIVMARRHMGRYEHSWSSLQLLLTVLWRAGRYDEAAKTLKFPPYTLSPEAWKEQISFAFASAFRDAPEDKTAAAFLEMRREKISWILLREMLDGCEGRLPRALPAKLLTPIVDDGVINPTFIARTAAAVRAAQGPQAGSEWLRAHIGKVLSVRVLARALYEAGEDELLWDPVFDGTSDAEFIWMMRAAAAQRSAAERAARAPALAAHYAAAKQGSEYLAGRFLSGLAGEESLHGGVGRTRAAWALAVRAESEGLRDEAAAWYSLASAGDWSDAEQRFATNWLTQLAEATEKTPRSEW
jgi:hypothetical protein